MSEFRRLLRALGGFWFYGKIGFRARWKPASKYYYLEAVQFEDNSHEDSDAIKSQGGIA